jgi:uncharacterized damage-inducible protein DinB
MEPRIPGFHGEYLWELDVARTQLLALAEAVPAGVYGWRPADGARPFSAVLVHIAAGNLALLHLAGAREPDGDGERFAAMIRSNFSLERTVTEKQDVIDLLRRSFEEVRQAFTESTIEDLEKIGNFFGERTTVRRVFFRMLAHTHEHMGQAIAYARANGLGVPWLDPLKSLDRIAEVPDGIMV